MRSIWQSWLRSRSLKARFCLPVISSTAELAVAVGVEIGDVRRFKQAVALTSFLVLIGIEEAIAIAVGFSERRRDVLDPFVAADGTVLVEIPGLSAAPMKVRSKSLLCAKGFPPPVEHPPGERSRN